MMFSGRVSLANFLTMAVSAPPADEFIPRQESPPDVKLPSIVVDATLSALKMPIIQRTLSDVAEGDRAIVKDIDENILNPAYLRQLGLIEGTEVRVTVGGNRPIITFKGTRLAIRANLMCAIKVEP